MKRAWAIGWVLLLLAATVAQAGERPKLQQPVVAASKLRWRAAASKLGRTLSGLPESVRDPHR